MPKGERLAQSHDVARRVRDRLLPIARSFGATLQVAEVPPGPPVLQTLVAEIYGPLPPDGWNWPRRSGRSSTRRPTWWIPIGTSRRRAAPNVTLVVDGEKAAAAGLSSAAVASVVRMAGSGEIAGLLHDAQAREDVPIVIASRAPTAASSGTRPVAPARPAPFVPPR